MGGTTVRVGRMTALVAIPIRSSEAPRMVIAVVTTRFVKGRRRTARMSGAWCQ